ncbi:MULTISPECIES: DUF1206 domain-containing protein [unclassified Modestobacter]|uniref:DUF1206 domain-containing protein n=1 Tax=unclassified Modestobacter TaxID=2643866 RepID=UPI0022AA7994|nr:MULTISPECIES: DUF1206 domain-containing protein [unclassified Modestobacter]MCZ2813765.1 DUF1206 domain-containing protein [Modestobacter sp. VKM Ac-2979]MCZ2844260.1 DUF1206 domain-containing protein [Modestobacter sp. VKM Ac-2980]MCZ2849063.1 DUF1206 domain-containing protein [Modestobacter sp. VKM Ac-2978]
MNAVPQRVHDAVARAREVTDHPVLEHLARVGLVAYGVLHLLIGWLAFRIAWFVEPGTEDADQTGALQAVSESPGGRVLLWGIGLGLFALALWQAGEVLRWWTGLLRPDHRLRTGVVCTKCAAKAVVYAVLGLTALFFAVGAGYQADERFQAMADDALEIPGGSTLVVAVGLGVAAVGLYVLVRGVTGKFMRDVDLDSAPDRWEPLIERLGSVGYVAKGIAFTVSGGLLVYAAATRDVSTATGLDGAMNAIGGVPTGRWLLTAVAVGFMAFGVYALVRARYPDRDPAT